MLMMKSRDNFSAVRDFPTLAKVSVLIICKSLSFSMSDTLWKTSVNPECLLNILKHNLVICLPF